VLCHGGPKTAGQLATATAVPLRKTKEALLVLYHHQIVQSLQPTKTELVTRFPQTGPTYYRIRFDAILNRLHIPQWILLFKKKIYQEGEAYNSDIFIAILSRLFLHTVTKGEFLMQELASQVDQTTLQLHLEKLYKDGFLYYYKDYLASKKQVSLEDFTHPDYALFSQKSNKRGAMALPNQHAVKRPKLENHLVLTEWITFQAERFKEESKISALRQFFSSSLSESSGELFELIFECYLENIIESSDSISLFKHQSSIPAVIVSRAVH
jgi:hypothetical protein